MTTFQMDYSRALYSFVGTRKHILSDKKYFCFVFDDLIVMAERNNDTKPKYVFPLTMDLMIGWKTQEKDKKEINLIAFTFKYKNNIKEMHATHQDLAKFKTLLANKVTFNKISQFYEAQLVLGKGSSCKVILIKEHFGICQYAAKSIDKAYINKSENGVVIHFFWFMFKMAFHQEVRILRTLSKFNNEQESYFPRLYEIFEGEQTYYLILDLLHGRTLQEEIEIKKEKQDHFKIKTIKQIMIQILKGVRKMHDAGIIHRDLKPDNIMFNEQSSYEKIKIIDFGLATEGSTEKYMFPKCGTPGYVAPEILNLADRSIKYSSVCDVFSCGSIFFKLLTGQSLFPGDQFKEVLKLNKICDIQFNTPVFQSIPKDAFDLLRRMLEKSPSLRISIVQAISHEFFQNSDDQTLGITSTKEALIHSEMLQGYKIDNKIQEYDEFSSNSIQDEHGEEKQDITNFPIFRRPTFKPHQKQQSTFLSPRNSLEYSRKSYNLQDSGMTFYMKESPLRMLQFSRNKVNVQARLQSQDISNSLEINHVLDIKEITENSKCSIEGK